VTRRIDLSRTGRRSGWTVIAGLSLVGAGLLGGGVGSAATIADGRPIWPDHASPIVNSQLLVATADASDGHIHWPEVTDPSDGHIHWPESTDPSDG
jgi:hypothetical protein